MCACVHTCTCTCTCMCVCAHVHMCVHMCVHVYFHKRTCVRASVGVCMCVLYVCTHVFVCECVHAHGHTCHILSDDALHRASIQAISVFRATPHGQDAFLPACVGLTASCKDGSACPCPSQLYGPSKCRSFREARAAPRRLFAPVPGHVPPRTPGLPYLLGTRSHTLRSRDPCRRPCSRFPSSPSPSAS